jgi:hypothetical protein
MVNPLDRILPPYTRRADTLGHRLRKTAVVAAVLGFAIVMGFWIAIFSTLVVPMFVAVIGILFLVAMWLADDQEPDFSRSVSVLLLAYVTFAIVWPSYLAIQIPGLPWVTPTRITLGLLALLLLLQLSQSRIARGQLTGAIKGMKVAFGAYALMMFTMFATAALAPRPIEALSFGALQVILWNIPLVAALWVLHDPKVVVRTMQAMGLSLLVVLLLTILEYRNELPIWIGHIPSFLKIDGPMASAVLTAQTRIGDGYRARGTYGVHLYYSQLLLMMLPFVVHWLLDARSAARRAWIVAFLLCMLVVIWMNNTRTASTGQLVVITGMLGLFVLRHYLHTQNRIDMTAPAFVLGVPSAAAVLAVLIAISPRLQNMTIGGSQHKGSNLVRDSQWERAWSAVFSNPIGYGAGESGPLTGRMTSGGLWIVDSTWINFLVDFGVLGALSWALFLGFTAGVGALIYLQKVDRSADLAGPAAIGVGSFMMSMYTISFFGNIPLLMILIALICATRHRLETAGLLAKPKDVLKPAQSRTGPATAAA